MLPLLLTLHNILRWLVLAAGIWAIVRAFQGWGGKREWNATDNRAGLLYTIGLDLQLLLGLILYFIASPITAQAMQDFGAAMSSSLIRYFAVEHSLLMLVAIIIAHIGRSLSKKASGASRFRRAAIWFTISLLLILAAIPWPFLNTGRPLLRLFGLEL